MKISRRDFARVTASLSVTPFLDWENAMAANRQTSWPGYAKAIVIDFLASPGPFNTSEKFTELSEDMVLNAVASGITGVNLTVGGGGTVEDNFETIAKWERELVRHPDMLMKIRTIEDLKVAKETKRLGLIFGFQDASVLETELSRIELFKSFGVQIIQLTYNGKNLIGDGCLTPENAGLSKFGLDVVAELNAKRVLIDLSHCGQQTTADAIRASKVPVAITHSGCTAVAQRPRNKRDEELKAMADKGGVIGIYLMPFLTMGKQPTDNDVMKHIEHAINICGEDHVGIGSDLSISPHVVTDAYRRAHADFVNARKAAKVAAPGEDPAVFMFVPELNYPGRMELIAQRLLSKGHKEARVEKIIGGNSVRLMKEVWGK